jgi:tetratricopeptide (TPR) repeat protein
MLDAFGALVRGAVASGAGHPAAADAHLDQAEAAFSTAGYDAGSFLVAWTRAEILLAQGDAAGALRLLDALAAAPAPQSLREESAVGLLASRLRARAALDDVAGSEALREELATTPRRLSSEARNLRAHQSLGRLYTRRGDFTKADAAYCQALEAAGKLYVMFTSPKNRARFAEVQAGLFAEANGCREKLKTFGQDQHLQEMSSLVAHMEHRRLARLQQSSRRLRRLAVGMILVNLVVLGSVAGWLLWKQATPVAVNVAGKQLRLPRSWPPTQTAGDYLLLLPSLARTYISRNTAFFIVSLLVWTALATGHLLLYVIAGWFAPSFRQRGSLGTLALAALPWVTWVGCVWRQ